MVQDIYDDKDLIGEHTSFDQGASTEPVKFNPN